MNITNMAQEALTTVTSTEGQVRPADCTNTSLFPEEAEDEWKSQGDLDHLEYAKLKEGVTHLVRKHSSI